MNIKQAKAHLLKCNGKDSWYAYSIEGSYNEGKQDACYSNFRDFDPDRFDFLGVGYYCKKDDEAGMGFLGWITGDKSPWRTLFLDDIELIEDDKYIHGFFMGPKTLKKANKKFLLNFLIASRNVNEFREHIDFWWVCVKEDIPPEVAYQYCKDFAFYGKDDFRQKIVHNTNHWPWNGKPDWKKITDSKPSMNSKYTNGIFAEAGSVSEYWGDDGTPALYRAHTGKYGNGRIPFSVIKDMDKDLRKK